MHIAQASRLKSLAFSTTYTCYMGLKIHLNSLGLVLVIDHFTHRFVTNLRVEDISILLQNNNNSRNEGTFIEAQIK